MINPVLLIARGIYSFFHLFKRRPKKAIEDHDLSLGSYSDSYPYSYSRSVSPSPSVSPSRSISPSASPSPEPDDGEFYD